MRTKVQIGEQRKTKRIILLVVSFFVITCGLFVAFMLHNIGQRRVVSVTAEVRLANGITEDEIGVVAANVSKITQPHFVVLNKTFYYIPSVTLPGDGSMATFRSCDTKSTYDTVKCIDQNGVSYWVTLTEIK